jgi:hypothetical protein
MFTRKMIRTVIAGIGLGVASLPLAVTAFAASNTSGLVPLSVQGVGSGAIANGDCQGIACKSGDICACLAATYTLVGNQGFGKGSFNLLLSVDTSATGLPISDLDSCSPATGTGTIKNSKGTVTLSLAISGFECPAINDAPDVFNGTYVVTNGTGKFSDASGGTGAINGSQVPASGGTGQVAITGSVQATAPVGPTPSPTVTATPTPSVTPTPTPSGSPTPTPSGSPTPTPNGSPTPTPTHTATPSPSPTHTATPSPSPTATAT